MSRARSLLKQRYPELRIFGLVEEQQMEKIQTSLGDAVNITPAQNVAQRQQL